MVIQSAVDSGFCLGWTGHVREYYQYLKQGNSCEKLKEYIPNTARRVLEAQAPMDRIGRKQQTCRRATRD